jgi:hypothetical protein
LLVVCGMILVYRTYRVEALASHTTREATFER